jgi:hypothetical protein
MINGTTSATPSGAAPTAQTASQQTPKSASDNAPATIGQKVLRGATVAVAIAIGATGGTFSAIGFLEYTQLTQVTEAAPMPTLVDENRAVWSAVTQLQNDIAVLKSNSESTPRASSNAGSSNSSATSNNTNGQLSNLNERFDRIERRIDALAIKETTGSVPAALQPKVAPNAPLAGWSVRDVYRNAALIQGAKLGMMEVSPGDNIPGLGRIHSIRQQDGRWVVITSRGIISQPR